VVICAHSYGGAPVTEALVGMGKVRHLVYLCAWQGNVGDSLLGARHGIPPPWWEMHEVEGYIDPLRPREVLYSDVDPPTANAAIAHLGHQSLAAVSQPLTQTGWRNIPSTYVLCEKDCAIPPAAQEQMARRADRVQRLDTSHSPVLEPAITSRRYTAQRTTGGRGGLNERDSTTRRPRPPSTAAFQCCRRHRACCALRRRFRGR
jgi:pimeloyl-ACP methyl ester carboxylesterase